jgi:hypothetical protein
MAYFTLIWDVTPLAGNANILSQTASYRQKSVGGAFLTDGFIPANPLSIAVNTVETKHSLLVNVVYEIMVSAICTVNGPIINDNGVQEAIQFSCIVPDVTGVTENSSGIVLNVTGLDITKARFTLKRTSTNVTVYSIIANRVVNSITANSGTILSPSTNYYWQVELYAVVNGLEVISSNSNYIGTACSAYPITTSAPATCNPITALTISSIEIP